MNARRSFLGAGSMAFTAALVFALAGCGTGSMDMDGGTDSGTPGCGTGFGACNPVTNTGCGMGQSCVIATAMSGMGITSTCVTPGSTAEGAACTAAEQCQAGLHCINNTCSRMCCGTSDNTRCGGGSSCNNPTMLGTQLSYLCRSTTTCDWITQNCPGTGNCVPTNASGTTVCEATGMGTAGTACGGATGVVCGRGLFCAGVMGSSAAACLTICNPMAAAGAQGSCPAGSNTRCTAVTDRPATFGVCIPMM